MTRSRAVRSPPRQYAANRSELETFIRAGPDAMNQTTSSRTETYFRDRFIQAVRENSCMKFHGIAHVCNRDARQLRDRPEWRSRVVAFTASCAATAPAPAGADDGDAAPTRTPDLSRLPAVDPVTDLTGAPAVEEAEAVVAAVDRHHHRRRRRRSRDDRGRRGAVPGPDPTRAGHRDGCGDSASTNGIGADTTADSADTRPVARRWPRSAQGAARHGAGRTVDSRRSRARPT